jgi:hypothetical protein
MNVNFKMTRHYTQSYQQIEEQYTLFFEFCEHQTTAQTPKALIYKELTKLHPHTMWLFANSVYEPGNEWVLDLRSRYLQAGGKIHVG